MDGYIVEDLDVPERRIRELVAQQVLPSAVEGFDIGFGDHPHFGDPAVWIDLHVPADDRVDFVKAQAFTGLISDLVIKLKHIVPGRLVSAGLHRPPSPPVMSIRAHA